MRIPASAARVFAVASAAALALLAAGGAASRPGGLWVGLATAGAAAGILLVAVGLLPLAGAPGARASIGFALPALLVLAGLPLAGVRAVSGGPLFALALAAAVLLLSARTRPAPRPVLVLPLAFLLFVLSASRSSVQVGPQGDEPHYLMVADSLLRDGDVSLEQDYASERYAAFHDAPLAPHFRVRGRHGEVYSLHAPGLSLLILPAWALAGYPGVTVFMALLAALLVLEVHAWVRELGGRDTLAAGTAALVALSPPLLHYAGLVFTEVPAALALSYGLRRARAPGLGPGGGLIVGLAAAVLPWLNVRYAPLALLVLVHALWRHGRPRVVLPAVAPAVASVVALAAYYHALYGFWDPRRVYGIRRELSAATLLEGLPGLLLDQEFGLLVYAPVLVLAVPGLLALVRRDRKLGLVTLGTLAAVLLTAGSWHMWRGGFNPPGRFLVPVAPLLFVATALVWDRRGVTAGAALLAGWGLWTGIGGALEPRLVHRDRDDTAPFFRAHSGAREWTALLPSYVLEDPQRHRLAAVWAGALLLAVPWSSRRRPTSAGRAAVAALGLVVAAQAADALATQPTGDRDAVRTVGRPALAVPGWRTCGAVAAEWTPGDAGLAPLYEPHRYPAGVVLGRRLRVPRGRYRVQVDGEAFAAGSSVLGWAWDQPGAAWHETRLAPDALVDWTAPPLEHAAADLRLRGGPPLLLRRVRLLRER